MAKITVDNFNEAVIALPGQNILNSLLHHDQPIHTICGGRARCGCCRIRVLEGERGLSPVNEFEKQRLGADALAEGWRLACQTHMLRDIRIHLPREEELSKHCARK
jgi:adenylate cyclase